jgi:fermentation-respiration switch protein FrsA (DUF1100 family)
MRSRWRGLALAALAWAALAAAPAAAGDGSRSEPFLLRGRQLTLRLYGSPGARTALLSSGDGGFIHLAPAVAQYLAGQGWFVIGVDSKQYLSSFTSGSTTLRVSDVPRDYAALVERAAQGAPDAPLLFGVSEGAGLSVLAASAPELQPRIAGVVALGLPDRNELGWRFRDSLIYVTKKTPNEPLFSSLDYVGRVSPLPLAIVRSTGDEFVSAQDSERIFAACREPRRLWVVRAADHRFSDNPGELQRVLGEAIAWITQQRQKAGSR